MVGPVRACCSRFADLLKFVLKEPIIPAGANKFVFLLAPLVTCVLALGGLGGDPVAPGWVVADINVGMLYLFAVSSLGVYGVIMGGWASNSKYPFLGALRSAAQMVSYEVSIGFVIITVMLLRRLDEPERDRRRPGSAASTGTSSAVPWLNGLHWYWLPLFPMFGDLLHLGPGRDQPAAVRPVEAESELVAGFMVEYGSTPYMLFMLGEYVANIDPDVRADHDPVPRRLAAAASRCRPSPGVAGQSSGSCSWRGFCSSSCSPWCKAFVPRYRYDQLMRLGWKVFLPLPSPWSRSSPRSCVHRAGATMRIIR